MKRKSNKIKYEKCCRQPLNTYSSRYKTLSSILLCFSLKLRLIIRDFEERSTDRNKAKKGTNKSRI
ncbi:hypothetical protein Hanom_Chr14g01269981 [Helianthus anomalus]